MKNNLTFSSIIALFALCGSILLDGCVKTGIIMPKDLIAEANKIVPSISGDEAHSNLGKQNFHFIDVREPEEFKISHIPGAINIPRGLIEFKIGEKIQDKHSSIIVYCSAGGRGALSGQSLMRLGYTKVLNLGGGFDEWNKKGYSVEKTPMPDSLVGK